jgi:hypothetical protein
VPPRLDLVLGVAGFLQPFAAGGQRANPGTLKLDERPPDPGLVGFRDGGSRRRSGRQSASVAEATGQDTGEQIRMILQVEAGSVSRPRPYLALLRQVLNV